MLLVTSNLMYGEVRFRTCDEYSKTFCPGCQLLVKFYELYKFAPGKGVSRTKVSILAIARLSRHKFIERK